MIDLQFYPTPLNLARKAWSKFSNRNFIRVLEPSAGNGDLLLGMPGTSTMYRRSVPIDCCEIDLGKHPYLRSLSGVAVVGTDFLELNNSGIYSHIIQNPPFNQGVHHVLKAWECMFDGEIVSIINAETLRNPNSREKEFLALLVEQHGNVEFITESFIGDDVERQTSVEIALVYLRKKSQAGEDIVGRLIGDMKVETAADKVEQLSEGFKHPQELAIPNSVIENIVLVFDSAVRTMREAVMAEAQANYYSVMIGLTMGEILNQSGHSVSANKSCEWIKQEITDRYLVLKDKSWANLMRLSDVTSKLSSTAKKRMDSAFEEIKTLEFTVSNISGFLRGLIENQGSIMLQMACDVFDLITHYHTGNVVFYRGWASNDKHRTCGMRVKKSRFVLPGNSIYGTTLSWEAEQRLADIDRVLAMLDEKEVPDLSLVKVFKLNMAELRRGERVTSSYLDVRFYPNVGTIHFYPRSQELMDKLNRLVGEYRQWLPPKTDSSKDFLRQYNDAEKFDKEFREELSNELKKDYPSSSHYSRTYANPLNGIFSNDDSSKSAAQIDAALTKVHERNGLHVHFQLERTTSAVHQEELLLLAE